MSSSVQRGLDAAKSDAELLRIAQLRQRAKAVGLPLDSSEAEIARAEQTRPGTIGAACQVFDPQLDDIPSSHPLAGRREKDVEHAGDQLMLGYGFRVIRFSQPRETKQTPGIPDRLYMHPQRQLVVWWEAKKPGGKQRPAQERFQALCIATGMDYVLGGVESLRQWLTRKLEAGR